MFSWQPELDGTKANTGSRLVHEGILLTVVGESDKKYSLHFKKDSSTVNFKIQCRAILLKMQIIIDNISDFRQIVVYYGGRCYIRVDRTVFKKKIHQVRILVHTADWVWNNVALFIWIIACSLVCNQL